MNREVTLYTRAQCHLCEEAEAMLAHLAPELGLTIIKRDIDADPDLEQRFNDIVPVIAMGDTIIAEAPVSEDTLRTSLQAAL